MRNSIGRALLLAVALCLQLSCDRGGPDTSNIQSTLTFSHPSGAFTVEVPQSWQPVEPVYGPGPVVRVSQSPDLVLSLTDLPPGVEPDLAAWVAKFFDDKVAASDLVQEKLDGGLAVHQEFQGELKGEPWRWWIRAVFRDGRQVTATVSDRAPRFEKGRDAYLKVLQTLKVRPRSQQAEPEEAETTEAEIAIVEARHALDQARGAATPLPTSHREADVVRIVEGTPERFWGRARDAEGTVHPGPSEDETTQLVKGKKAEAIVEDAVVVGLADWCGLDWKSAHEAAQDARRAQKWSDRDVAYAGVLFGFSHGEMKTRMREEIGRCNDDQREEVRERLEKSQARDEKAAAPYRRQQQLQQMKKLGGMEDLMMQGDKTAEGVLKNITGRSAPSTPE